LDTVPLNTVDRPSFKSSATTQINIHKDKGIDYGNAFNQQRKLHKKGASFMVWFYKKHITEAVLVVINNNQELLAIHTEHPMFKYLMEGVLDNTILLFPPIILTPLTSLTQSQANTIGRKLSKTLQGKRTAEAGADQWMRQHPAIVELSEEDPFFMPMIVTISQQKLDDAIWGKKFRIYFGAGLSLLDMWTDIMTIVRFFKKGRDGSAYASMCFIAASLIVQLLIVVAQNKKRG